MTAVSPLENVRRTATRLLGSSAKNSYDPDLDIDWGIDQPKLSTRDAAGCRLADVGNLPKYGAI